MNIAPVYEAGATATGRPYFVMELVRGTPITEYCDSQRLTTAQRLELFMQVCGAIQHAHQKGIIHRDLKPSNIVVSLQDGTPVPKVIDFGIAKSTLIRLTDKTQFTRHDLVLGTPAYMSPEQVGMGEADVDSRSDIYSLGVLLYELLTGSLPFGSDTLRLAAIEEVRRIIQEDLAGPLYAIAWVQLKRGDHEDAEQTFKRVVELGREQRQTRGPACAYHLKFALRQLGRLQILKGQYAEAESCFREALPLVIWAYGDEHRDTFMALTWLR